MSDEPDDTTPPEPHGAADGPPPPSPLPPMPLPPPSDADEGWYEDPTGRHQRRFWGGGRWTDLVADGGAPFRDPILAPPQPAQGSGCIAALKVIGIIILVGLVLVLLLVGACFASLNR